MAVSLDDRYKILKYLNDDLIRSDAIADQYGAHTYPSEFYRFDATLTPTEYQKNRPVPLIFKTSDIFPRIDLIETIPAKETLLLSVLSTLDTIETNLNAESTSANGALVRADVLEWDVSRRTDGMKKLRRDKINELRTLLEDSDGNPLPPSPSPWVNNCSGNTLFRS